MTFLLFLFGIFLALGMFLLTADLLRLPRLATQRAMLSVGRQEKKQARSVEALLMGWAIKLAPHIHMDEYKRGRLKNTLAAAGLNMTPEEYTAFAIGNTTAALDELYVWLSDNVSVGTTIIEYIRNTLKRVRKKESNLIMASQNLEDFDREGIRELTKPLFAIPPHQFIFNCGSIDKRFYMDLLQLEEAEYNLIRFPQRGVCLFKCGNERYLLEVHAPAYKEALFGTAGGR